MEEITRMTQEINGVKIQVEETLENNIEDGLDRYYINYRLMTISRRWFDKVWKN